MGAEFFDGDLVGGLMVADDTPAALATVVAAVPFVSGLVVLVVLVVQEARSVARWSPLTADKPQRAHHPIHADI